MSGERLGRAHVDMGDPAVACVEPLRQAVGGVGKADLEAVLGGQHVHIPFRDSRRHSGSNATPIALELGSHIFQASGMRLQAPVRVTRTYTQTLDGTAEEVMPLLCPVREAEWVEGWDPGLVLSESGFVERDCVFTTPDGEREAVWVVTEHEPARGLVEMIKTTPGFAVVRLHILLRPLEAGSAGAPRTAAEVTYRYTALGPEGEAFVRGRTEEAYGELMRAWEAALNNHLRVLRQSSR